MRHIEYLNLNSQRSYPIKEDASKTDVSGNFKLPTEFLVDCVIAIDTSEIEELYIKQVIFLPDIVTVMIADQNTDTVGACTIAASSHTPNDYYVIQGYGNYVTLQGKLNVGEIPSVVGIYDFEPEATTFEAGVLIPNLRGVASFGIYSQKTSPPDPLEGHVKLIPGYNIRLTYDYAYNAIRVDAIEGAGLGTSCTCPEEDIPPGEPMKFLNGMPPDESGNANIQGVGCISVENIANGVRISNTCEDVCCDCEDVADLQDISDNLQNQITALEVRVQAAETN